MRVFVPPPVSASDLNRARDLLLAANIVAQSSALIYERGNVTSGVIVLLRAQDAAEAVEILVRAGIKARI